jgi:hypothetical protein
MGRGELDMETHTVKELISDANSPLLVQRHSLCARCHVAALHRLQRNDTDTSLTLRHRFSTERRAERVAGTQYVVVGAACGRIIIGEGGSLVMLLWMPARLWVSSESDSVNVGPVARAARVCLTPYHLQKHLLRLCNLLVALDLARWVLERQLELADDVE